MFKKLRILLSHRLISVSLFILLQLALIVFLASSGSRLSIWIEYGLTVSSIIIVISIVGETARSAFRVMWIILILAFPVFGGLLYLLLNNQAPTRRFQREWRREEQRIRPLLLLPGAAAEEGRGEAPEYGTLRRYLRDFAGFPAYGHTKTEYLSPGEAKFERLIEVLKKAERYIFLEYFTISEGKFWNTVLEILEEKAARGVDVRVIYDDVGCLLLPRKYPKQLRAMGIRCEVFNPVRPFLTAKQNNRDHRKIAVVDGKAAITGGINLADEYINARKKHGHWKDAATLVEGEAAWSFALMFLQMWGICTKTAVDYETFYPWKAAPCAVPDDGLAQPYADSPLSPERVGAHVYLQLIYGAKESLYINTPYLIIDETMMTALTQAAKSGVDVRIVVPHHPDKPYVHMVTRSNYRELVGAGAKVYEYSDGFIHSKTFVCDGKSAAIGSVNLDYRSLYLSFECGVCLYGSGAVGALYADYLNTLRRCRQITQQDCKCGRITRLLQDVLRLFSPLF